MSPARPLPSSPVIQLEGPASATRVDPAPPTVPKLLMRRQYAQRQSRSARRLPFLTFTLGILVGIGCAGPLPRQMAATLAGFIHAPDGIAAVVKPDAMAGRPILVLGSDVVGGNTDVMFIVQIEEGTTKVLQVPRDTYIESEQLGVIKANALYGMVGPEQAMAELSRLLSLPIQDYFKVNLDAVARLADAMGGVEIDVPKRMYYVDNTQGLYIDLYPGRQLLKGEALEGFLRYRNDELGDLGRMDRQRLVLREVFSKLANPATLARLPALLQIAGEDMRTNLSPLELTQVARAVVDTRLSTDRVPGSLYWHNDLSYWLPDVLRREAVPSYADQGPQTADLDTTEDHHTSTHDGEAEWTTLDSPESVTVPSEEPAERIQETESPTSI